jgi:hypothetical protein
MAAESLAVLVPVLNRPQNVAPLVESFLSSGTPGFLRFMVSEGDDEEWNAVAAAWSYDHRVGGIISYGAHSWPEKINFGVEQWDADWYLCAADDVTFTEGWWDATEQLRTDPSIGVIGTNDSVTGRGNPRVASGDHTVHPLVRGIYARTPNLDGGPFCVESVKHWYSDDLIVAVAQHRGAWAFCPEAIIEHHHPYWHPNTIPFDATYQLGESSAEQDREAAQAWAGRWLH